MAYNGDYRKRLREIADEVGKPLNELCYEMDRSHSFLSDIINGRQNMRVDDLEVFCSIVGIEPADFFGTDRDDPDIGSDCSQLCLEVVYEVKKCDDVLLRTLLALLKEVNGRRR
ncbi:MAG: helix-turn-helix transcriptional regulator [Lachnospiraceae bacterium]|nr:helix-turn-helix transcriptional regulator [Lachnospiraceae bacterium]MBP5653833.1 helix-turn-helix transcriptional regulator [Lachnospiraceae bacterium]